MDGDFRSPVESVVCTEKGVCYFVLECGKLGAYSVSNQEWSLLADSFWIARPNMNLVEFNGDVLLAKTCSQNEWEVFRFDWKERGWIKQKSLGDTALFIGCTS